MYNKNKVNEIVKLPMTDEGTIQVIQAVSEVTDNMVLTPDGVTIEKTREMKSVVPVKTIESIRKEMTEDALLYESILEEHPDIMLGIEILASMISSPNDMRTTSIVISSSDTILPIAIKVLLDQTITSIANKRNGLNLRGDISKIISDTLIYGARVKAYISPKQITDFSNMVESSSESLVSRVSNNIDSDVVTYVNNLLEVTYDPSSLSLSEETIESVESVLPQHSRHLYDDESEGNDEDLFKALNPNYKLELTNEDGIAMNIPVTSIIPGSHRNDPSRHLIYYVLLDEDGFPLTDIQPKENDNKYNVIRNIIEQAKRKPDSKRNRTVIDTEAIDSVIDNELYSMAVHPEHKRVLSKSSIDMIYKTVFARIAKGKKIKVLVLPKESVSYIALSYHNNGTGKSILHGMIKDASDRTILTAVTRESIVKAAIPTVEYKIKLDDKTPNPSKVMKEIMALIAENNQSAYPGLITNRDDLSDWLRSVGKTFNFKHPELPDMEIDKTISQQQVSPPDETRIDSIKKSMYARLSLTPEIIDSAFSSEFASIGIANRALLAKRAEDDQDILEPQLNKLVRCYISASGKDYTILKNIIIEGIENHDDEDFKKLLKESKKKIPILAETLLERYLDNIEVELPKPEAKSEGLAEQYATYSGHVDTYIDSYISEESVGDFISDLNKESLDKFKSAVKGKLLRDWMREHNYTPEISALFTATSEGEEDTSMGEHVAFAENVNNALSKYNEAVNKDKEENNETDPVDPEVDEKVNEDDPTPVDDETDTKVDEVTDDDTKEKDEDAKIADKVDDLEEEFQSNEIDSELLGNVDEYRVKPPLSANDIMKAKGITIVPSNKKAKLLLYNAMRLVNKDIKIEAASLLISVYDIYTRNGAYVVVKPTATYALSLSDEEIDDTITYSIANDDELLNDVRDILTR